jgi:hypothetical protein
MGTAVVFLSAVLHFTGGISDRLILPQRDLIDEHLSDQYALFRLLLQALFCHHLQISDW